MTLRCVCCRESVAADGSTLCAECGQFRQLREAFAGTSWHETERAAPGDVVPAE